MKRERTFYTNEFKTNALKEFNSIGSYSKASVKLGINQNLLRAWKKKLDEANIPYGVKDSNYDKLKKENELLREIIKNKSILDLIS